MDLKDIEQYILSLPNTWSDRPFEEDVIVYKVGPKVRDGGVMLALVNESKLPLSISLRCDPQLATLLREKYVAVMPAQKLNKKKWNNIILSGQLEVDEVKDLIRHSYEISKDLEADD